MSFCSTPRCRLQARLEEIRCDAALKAAAEGAAPEPASKAGKRAAQGNTTTAILGAINKPAGELLAPSRGPDCLMAASPVRTRIAADSQIGSEWAGGSVGRSPDRFVVADFDSALTLKFCRFAACWAVREIW